MSVDPAGIGRVAEPFEEASRDRYASIVDRVEREIETVDTDVIASRQPVREVIATAIDEGLDLTLSEVAVESGEHWTATYLDEAQMIGIQHGTEQLRRIMEVEAELTTLYQSRYHARQRRSEYGSQIRDLRRGRRRAVTDATQTFYELEDAGTDRDEISDRVADRVETVGATNAARTAQYRSTSSAAGGAFGVMAYSDGTTVDGVLRRQRRFVYTTAGLMSKPCSLCNPHSDVVYTAQQIDSGTAPQIPLHPYCRCLYNLLA